MRFRDLLQERGQAVRALVRREDDRADTLRKSGAEVALGDFRDFESVRAALEGIAALTSVSIHGCTFS